MSHFGNDLVRGGPSRAITLVAVAGVVAARKDDLLPYTSVSVLLQVEMPHPHPIGSQGPILGNPLFSFEVPSF